MIKTGNSEYYKNDNLLLVTYNGQYNKCIQMYILYNFRKSEERQREEAKKGCHCRGRSTSVSKRNEGKRKWLERGSEVFCSTQRYLTLWPAREIWRGFPTNRQQRSSSADPQSFRKHRTQGKEKRSSQRCTRRRKHCRGPENKEHQPRRSKRRTKRREQFSLR